MSPYVLTPTLQLIQYSAGSLRVRWGGIVAERAAKKEYLIKWLGYAQEHNSWEPEDELFNDSDLQDSEIVERYRRNPNDLTRPPQPRR